jgi:hypothetical protein
MWETTNSKKLLHPVRDLEAAISKFLSMGAPNGGKDLMAGAA